MKTAYEFAKEWAELHGLPVGIALAMAQEVFDSAEGIATDEADAEAVKNRYAKDEQRRQGQWMAESIARQIRALRG